MIYRWQIRLTPSLMDMLPLEEVSLMFKANFHILFVVQTLKLYYYFNELSIHSALHHVGMGRSHGPLVEVFVEDV